MLTVNMSVPALQTQQSAVSHQ